MGDVVAVEGHDVAHDARVAHVVTTGGDRGSLGGQVLAHKGVGPGAQAAGDAIACIVACRGSGDRGQHRPGERDDGALSPRVVHFLLDVSNHLSLFLETVKVNKLTVQSSF